MPAVAGLANEVIAKYQPVIGLEVHVQLLTKTKAFCGCKNEYGGEPNTHICPVCLGLPGALPVLNRQAVEFAMLAAEAIGCTIHERSVFARKNYFYPDLAEGLPDLAVRQAARRTWLAHCARIDAMATPSKPIGITRLHMEEDAGKSLHDGFPDSATRTYIDLNRCGTPLVEIVSEPDIRTPDEAFEYLTRPQGNSALHRRQRLQHGRGFAALRRERQRHARRAPTQFGTKAEVKNVNSFRYIRAALEYEIERQIGVIEEGGRVVQESRLWNNAEGRTYSMRSKGAGARLPLLPRAGPSTADRRRSVACATSSRQCRSFPRHAAHA